MSKLVASLATGVTLGLMLSALPVFGAPVEAQPAAKECKASGSDCKFGSECCSKVCKASYTCK
jgi:hypothetical protein